MSDGQIPKKKSPIPLIQTIEIHIWNIKFRAYINKICLQEISPHVENAHLGSSNIAYSSPSPNQAVFDAYSPKKMENA